MKNNHAIDIDKVLLYIQTHLDEDINLKELGEIINLSPYHFHRIFKKYTKETPKSYIRRLRLEKAAFRFRIKNENILSVALDSGYKTHESFTRAFFKTFHILPSNIQQFSYNNEQNSLKNIKVTYFKQRECLYKRHIGEYDLCDTPDHEKSLWHQLVKSQNSSDDIIEYELYGISHDDPEITLAQNIRYDACIYKDTLNESSTNLKQVLYEGYYLSATHQGDFHSLIESYYYLLYNWIPKNKITINLNIAPFEQFHLNKDANTYNLDYIEIFIPIITTLNNKIK